MQTDSFTVLRELKKELATIERQKEIVISINPQVFEYFTAVEYNAILALEKEFKTKLTLLTDPRLKTDQYKLQKK